VLSLLLPVRHAGYAGVFYSANGVVGFVLGSTLGKRERLTLERMKAKPAAASHS
jgi:hypothetical protein